MEEQKNETKKQYFEHITGWTWIHSNTLPKPKRFCYDCKRRMIFKLPKADCAALFNSNKENDDCEYFLPMPKLSFFEKILNYFKSF